MKKEGSSLALLSLMDILPVEFFYKYEVLIIKALIYALNTLPEYIMVTAHKNCPDALYKLIKKCHFEPHFVLVDKKHIVASPKFLEYIQKQEASLGVNSTVFEDDFVNQFKEICRRFSHELKSERKFARLVSKECLELIISLEKLPLETVLNIDGIRYSRNEENIPMDLSAPSKTELERLKDYLFDKKWSEDFKSYEYSEITAGLDCISYLFTKDKQGDLLGKASELGNKLIDMNEELLSIIQLEISNYEDLRRSPQDQSLQNYYMLLEKRHNYFHATYENSTGAIYNHPLRTEKERIEAARDNTRVLQQQRLQRKQRSGYGSASSDQIRGPPQSPEERLSTFTSHIMSIKETTSRQNLLRGDSYIYKVFPNCEARLKAVCKCLTVLCDEYTKACKENDWSNELINTEEMKAIYKEQRSKYLITLFRFVLREEKCIHNKAKKCMEKMLKLQPESEDFLPEKVFKECLKQCWKSKISDLIEYKKMMSFIKLFPKSFPHVFWEKLVESLVNIINKLKDEETMKLDSMKMKHNTEFYVAAFLISSYRHKKSKNEHPDFFKLVIKQVLELQKLIYAYGIPDVMIKTPLANLFNYFAEIAVQYIKENYAFDKGEVLKLTSSVVAVKTAKEFRDYLAQNGTGVLLDILREKSKSIEDYGIIHEVLSIVYILHKKVPGCVVNHEKLVHEIATIWLSFIPKLGYSQNVTWHLQ